MTDQDQPFDMNALLQQAQQMGEQLMAAQEQAAAAQYELSLIHISEPTRPTT